MSQKSKIEWTDASWSPIVGCSRKSEGCRNCWSERFLARFGGIQGHKFEGLSRYTEEGPRWSGTVRLAEDSLEEPLRWKKPRKIFVCSTSDLFHEKVQDEWIDKVFAVMALSTQHTFQVLTKRPQRMNAYLSGSTPTRIQALMDQPTWINLPAGRSYPRMAQQWPLPNIWLGVSCEDQKTADERIPLLLQTPAAVRWISAEPLLGPVEIFHKMTGDILHSSGDDYNPDGLNWVVVGGESGPKARSFHLDWARDIIAQCHAAHDGVPVFVKQLGSNTIFNGAYPGARFHLENKKGGDIEEWPADLRIREFPKQMVLAE